MSETRRYTLRVPVGLWERLERLLQSTRRDAADEICAAIRRHCDSPPTVRLIETAPSMPAEEVVTEGRRGPGRPRKNEAPRDSGK